MPRWDWDMSFKWPCAKSSLTALMPSFPPSRFHKCPASHTPVRCIVDPLTDWTTEKWFLQPLAWNGDPFLAVCLGPSMDHGTTLQLPSPAASPVARAPRQDNTWEVVPFACCSHGPHTTCPVFMEGSALGTSKMKLCLLYSLSTLLV